MDDVIARFYDKISCEDERGCWIWGASCLKGGYGKFTIHKKDLTSHRVSYMIHKGEIPLGFVVRHTCDNPKCVNPDHLLVGTRLDNVRDMDDRGRRRTPSGENHKNSKLTRENVIYIRQEYPLKSMEQLAKELGVCRGTVRDVVWGITWMSI